MRSYLSLGTGIISLQMSAVPPTLWDLAADQCELLDLKEESKIHETKQCGRTLVWSVLQRQEGAPLPRLKFSSAGGCVHVTLSSLERNWGDGRSDFLCLVKGGEIWWFPNDWMTWSGEGLDTKCGIHQESCTSVLPHHHCVFPLGGISYIFLAQPAKKLNQKAFFLLVVFPQ